MSNGPRKVTHLSPEKLNGMAVITDEDKVLAQVHAPKPLREVLNAGSPD